jgi:uncharacterized protein YkwD
MAASRPPKPPSRRWAWLVAVAAAAALSACGGGGGAGEGAAPIVGGSGGGGGGVPGPEAPAAEPGSRITCMLPGFRTEALALINAHRAAGARCGSQGDFASSPALAWNAPLTQAALVHADDMAAAGFFGHTGSDGSDGGQRALAAGYLWSAWGENIAAGHPTVAAVVAAWMASPGHCASIMQPAFRDVGLVCVGGAAGSRYATYLAMSLGAAR